MATVQEIDAFGIQVQTMLAAHHATARNVGDASTITVEYGPKYARIVRTDHGNRSAYAFVERATGSILKPDGWKKPAKHARGNIADPNPLACCGPYGVAYLR